MKLPAINLTRKALADFNEAIGKEWLLTNGLGGYAASSVLCVNTRKYHGLLVAALHPPGDRTVCLAKLDEDVLVGNSVYRLGANEFHDKIYPEGYRFLNKFVISPFPSYTYNLPNIDVTKTVFMPKGKNAVAAIYKILNHVGANIKFRVYPLLTSRHFHEVLDRKGKPLGLSQKQNGREVEVSFNASKVTVTVYSTTGEFNKKETWIERLHYREEANRGESSTDNCYQPGYFEVLVPHKREKDFAVVTVASENNQKCHETLDTIGNTLYEVNAQLKSELMRQENLVAKFYGVHSKVPTNEWFNWMLLATDSFTVKGTGSRKAIMAGYYWFETWGRDTFVSLPGLLLINGRIEDAKKILLDFMYHRKQGLIPNFVQDRSGEPVYNTVDATLWYVNAVLQFLKYTGDFTFIQKYLWEGLKEIVYRHEKGTSFGIGLDSDGLLMHGSQLTWMDAYIDGEAVTPRAGKAVEIQALWYNALKTMQLLANKFEEANLADKYAEVAFEAQKSFTTNFWDNENGCLIDVMDVSNVDSSLRPNQIIAAALDFTMLNSEKSKQVVNVVQRELVTPYGLRTLARSDPRYKGRYTGDRLSRDHAYHNGTVWPWLLGPFVTAFLRVKERGELWLEYALQNFLLPLFTQQIYKAGLGTLSEIFDGDAPHSPRGCVAQAWSVAEPLRAYVEDVLQVRPKYEKEVLQA